MSRWFRFYDDALDHPKVQRLEPALFKFWVNLLCLASRNEGLIPEVSDVAFSLRLSEKAAGQNLDALLTAGLLDMSEGERLVPHNWNARQFKGDVSTGRVKAFRKRKAKQDETVSETPPDTEQSRAETEEDTTSLRSVVPAPEEKPKRKSGISENWGPSSKNLEDAQRYELDPLTLALETEKFRDHHLKVGSVFKSWDAAWRTWLQRIPDHAKRATGPPRSMSAKLSALTDQPIGKTYDDYLAKHEDRNDGGDAGGNPPCAPPALRAISGARR